MWLLINYSSQVYTFLCCISTEYAYLISIYIDITTYTAYVQFSNFVLLCTLRGDIHPCVRNSTYYVVWYYQRKVGIVLLRQSTIKCR